MVIKVGINGFGRIGRIMFRTCVQNTNVEVTAINDPAIDVEYICYLIKFDSTHGNFNGDIVPLDDAIKINGSLIKIFREKLPSSVQWHLAGVQYVIESSGMFTNYEKAVGHLAAEGVRRVVVTAPSVDVPMLIMGVNEDELKPDEKVISSASSTLYCLATIIKVLENDFGVAEGFVTSIHAMTPSLKPLDGLCLRGKHWRDYRSIHQNIIPATTGACKALGKILPRLKDKLVGLAFRVPIVNVSVLDLTVRLNKDTSLQKVIESVENASRTYMKGVLNLSNEEAVSSDFMRDSHSCILDVKSSIQHKPDFYKFICWYENEFSYACRVIDTILLCEKQFNQTPQTIHIKNKNIIVSKKHIIKHSPESFRHFMTLGNDCNTKAMPDVLRNVSKAFDFKISSVSPYIPFRRKAKVSVMNQTTSCYEAKHKSDIYKIVDYDLQPAPRAAEENERDGCVTLKVISNEPKKDKPSGRLIKAQEEVNKMMRVTRELLKQSNVCKIVKENEKELDKNNKTNIKEGDVDKAKVEQKFSDSLIAKEHSVDNVNVVNANIKKDEVDNKEETDKLDNMKLKKGELDNAKVEKDEYDNANIKKDELDTANIKKVEFDIANIKKVEFDNVNIKKDELDNAKVTQEELGKDNVKKEELQKDDVDGTSLKKDDGDSAKNKDDLGKPKEEIIQNIENSESVTHKLTLEECAREIAKIKEQLTAKKNPNVEEAETQNAPTEYITVKDSFVKDGAMQRVKVTKASTQSVDMQQEMSQNKIIRKKVIRAKSNKSTSVTVVVEPSSESVESLPHGSGLFVYSKTYKAPVSDTDSAVSCKIDASKDISDDENVHTAAAPKKYKSFKEPAPIDLEDNKSDVSLKLIRNDEPNEGTPYNTLIKIQEEINKLVEVTQALQNELNVRNIDKKDDKEKATDKDNIKDDAVDDAKLKQDAVDDAQLKDDAINDTKVKKDDVENTKTTKYDVGLTKAKEDSIQNEEDNERALRIALFEECAREIAKIKEFLMQYAELEDDTTQFTTFEECAREVARVKELLMQHIGLEEDTTPNAIFEACAREIAKVKELLAKNVELEEETKQDDETQIATVENGTLQSSNVKEGTMKDAKNNKDALQITNIESDKEPGHRGLEGIERDSYVSLTLLENDGTKKDIAYDRLIKAQEEVNKMMEVTQSLINKSNASNINEENDRELSTDKTNIKDNIAKEKDDSVDDKKVKKDDFDKAKEEVIINEEYEDRANRDALFEECAKEIAKIKEFLMQHKELEENPTLNEIFEECAREIARVKELLMQNVDLEDNAPQNPTFEECAREIAKVKELLKQHADLEEEAKQNKIDEEDAMQNTKLQYGALQNSNDKEGTMKHAKINKATLQNANAKSHKGNDETKKDIAYDRLIKAQEEVNKMMEVTQSLINKSNASSINVENDRELRNNYTNFKHDAVHDTKAKKDDLAKAKAKQKLIQKEEDEARAIRNAMFEECAREIAKIKEYINQNSGPEEDSVQNAIFEECEREIARVREILMQYVKLEADPIQTAIFEECAREIAKVKELLKQYVELEDEIKQNENFDEGEKKKKTTQFGHLLSFNIKKTTTKLAKMIKATLPYPKTKTVKDDSFLSNEDSFSIDSGEEEQDDGREILRRLLSQRHYSVNPQGLDSDTSIEISDVDLSGREDYTQHRINEGCLKVGKISNSMEYIDIDKQLKTNTAEYTTKYVITGKMGEGTEEKGESKISRQYNISTIDKPNISQNKKQSNESINLDFCQDKQSTTTELTNTLQDIYDKLDSASATNSDNSFDVNEKKSQVIRINDLTDSLEDLGRLEKICKIIEISDDLSDALFAKLKDNDGIKIRNKKWSLKDLCEKINLNDFCKKLFHDS